MDTNPRNKVHSRQILAGALVLLIVSMSCSMVDLGEEGTAEVITPPPSTTAPISTTAPVPTEVVPSVTPTPTATPFTPVAVIKPDSLVRRLISGVFAGEKKPLPGLESDDPVALGPNGLVTTDKTGEAEIQIKDCLKLYIFQASSLTRSTCRKSDQASGLGVCGLQGLTGVINKCTSQVNIQSPSSDVVSKGTWFTVMYLPDDQLTIVQVFEDRVEVRAVINPAAGQMAAGQAVGAGSLWFTSPGDNPPIINGIRGRTVQPMNVWEALRPVLIQKYPNIDLWMNTASKQARTSNLRFDNRLVHPTGEIDLNFVGKPWDDQRVQDAMLTGVDWKGMNQNLWPGTTVTTQIKFNAQTITDIPPGSFDPARAKKLLAEAGYWQNTKINSLILVPDGDQNAFNFGDGLSGAFYDLGLNPVFQVMSDAEIKKLVQGAGSNPNTILIWLGTSGDAFRSTPTP